MRSMTWKDVQLPPLSKWQGIAHYSFSPEGIILVEPDEDGKVSVDFSPMRPGSPTRLLLNLSVEPAPGKTVNLTFSEQHRILEGGTQQIIIETGLILDPVLTITGIASVQIISLQVQIRFPDRSKPLPYDLIGFEVLTPNLSPGFIIGKSRISSEPLGVIKPRYGEFIIGQSRLDHASLSLELPTFTWKDILAQGLTLSYRVGANKGSTLLPVAQAGSAIIEIKDLDPRKTVLRAGLKCRLYHRLTRRVLFTGKLRSFRLTPAKCPREHDIATLEFADNVAELAGVKRYGVRTDTPDTLQARIGKLLEGTGIDWSILEEQTPVANELGATVMEANLAEYLDMTCATVGGAWWVTTEGKIIINPNNEVNIWKNIPFFIIGQTPLDGGKLAVNGVELLQEPVLEQVENPFIIGKSRLDHAAAGANLTDKGFIIGKSRLNETTLTGIAKNTAWAIEKPTAPPLFTDRYNTGRRSFYYIDLGTSFASNETVSEIVVENHTAIKEDNSWNDSTKTYKASDNNIAAIYGQSARSVKANASTAQNAQQLAEYLLKRPQEQIAGLKVSSVQMNALNCSKTLAALDLFDYCQVRFKEETSDHQIYAFESQLTPYTWKERLYLTPAKERKISRE
ncbi:hypothetical protein [Mobiluncus curtisii]|uniref:Uncharacterized protein n=3 Tax=Mobiluncus curtisii TaxID=2051 RepID=D6ZGG1_MOBCV|nr:hypothetical protein [Mobiluncus curtisii]ADI67719.1 hypothetical protein HMPREF0573_11400 [Mobiluncus curtisii ATCC 43063]SQB64842.1 Uncharacterised protein [Mobiluncus curtisii]